MSSATSQRKPQHKGKAPYKPNNAAKGGRANSKARDNKIIDKIMIQFVTRTRVEIDSWRRAISTAEDVYYPRRTPWADIVKDLDLDAHWSSQKLIRKLSVMCKPFKVVDKVTRKEIPERTRLFQSPWFYYLMDTRFEAKFSGTKAMEVQDLIQGNLKKSALYLIPFRHVLPERKMILLNANSTYGQVYTDDPYILVLEEEEFLGLLCKAAPHIIFKRNAMQAWAEFCEKFGIPLRYVTTNKKDDATITRIDTMLDKLGSAAKAIFPEGTTLNFQQPNTTDAFEVFDRIIDRCNSELSKLINAVTMISDNGSSLSQSKVHKEINEKVVQSDCNEFQGLVNWEIGPQLRQLGFAFDPEKEEWIFDDTEKLSLGALWNIVQGLLTFYEVDQTWLVEKFQIPVTKARATPLGKGTSGNIPNNLLDGKDMASAISEAIGKLLKVTSESDKETLNKTITETFLKVIDNANFNSAQSQAASAELRFDAAKYSKLLSSHGSLKIDPQNSAVDSLFEKAMKAFFDDPSNKPSTLSEGEWNDLYLFVSDKLYKAVESGYGINLDAPDLDATDKELLTQLRSNIYNFSALKNQQLLLQLNDLLKDENGKLREWADFKEKALAIANDYNKAWLETEYNTAVATAQFQSNYNTWIKEAGDYDLTFQTAMDDRVRPTHAENEGITAQAGDPIVLSLATPLDYNCRCEWVQFPKGTRTITSPSSVSIPDRPRGLSTNPGTVFTDQHPYNDGLSDADKIALAKLARKTIDNLDK
jgi:SPP1 gp7 family putative phage head morphogenesis protein